jgi:hypothetical protein
MRNAAVLVGIALLAGWFPCAAHANTYSPYLETRVDDDHVKPVLPSVRISADTAQRSELALAADILRPISLRWSLSLELGVRLSVNQNLAQLDAAVFPVEKTRILGPGEGPGNGVSARS